MDKDGLTLAEIRDILLKKDASTGIFPEHCWEGLHAWVAIHAACSGAAPLMSWGEEEKMWEVEVRALQGIRKQK